MIFNKYLRLLLNCKLRTMSDWCDDFEIKAGDRFTVESNTSTPARTNLDTSWNVPDWTSIPVCNDPWVTDPKVRFASNVIEEEPEDKFYPQPSDDTGDALEYIPNIDSNISNETKYINTKSNESLFKGKLKNSLAVNYNSREDSVEYLDILNVFKYVTLGGMISDEYIDSFCKYIYDSNTDFKNRTTCKEEFISVAGHKFYRYMVMYNRTDYLELVKLCVDWAKCNPEKVIMT